MKKNLAGLNLPYNIRILTEKDISEIYALCKANKLYYEHMKCEPTHENLKETLTALPLGKTPADKHFVGFYDNNRLIAILDLIENYPVKGIIWIGWFMTDMHLHNTGLGTTIISALCVYLRQNNFQSIALGYIKGNQQAKNFWLKQGFHPYGDEIEEDLYTIIKMQKEL